MAAAKYTLKIEQGATFDKTFTWKNPDNSPVDLTGCVARMHARAKVGSTEKLLDLTTANGGLVLGGAAGTVRVLVSAADTEAITWVSAVYDLEVEFSDGFVRRLVQGGISVSPEVTRG